MRLFIAVEIAESIRRSAGDTAERISRDLGPAARRAVTWVQPGRMHLTVRFLGEVAPAVAEELVRRCAAPLATSPFRLTVSGVGAFPASGPLRVIWLGISEGQQELGRLHDEIEERLVGLGLERDDRPFRAHLTLGRVKAPLGPAARGILAQVPAGTLGSCTVDHAILFESRLSPSGPTYSPLARMNLGMTNDQ